MERMSCEEKIIKFAFALYDGHGDHDRKLFASPYNIALQNLELCVDELAKKRGIQAIDGAPECYRRYKRGWKRALAKHPEWWCSPVIVPETMIVSETESMSYEEYAHRVRHEMTFDKERRIA